MNKTVRRLMNALVDWYGSYGLRLRVSSTDRTYAQQDALFRAGKTTLRGGESLHNFGRAFDVVPGVPWPDVPKADSYQHIASAGRLLGLEAIVERDHVHFELDDIERP